MAEPENMEDDAVLLESFKNFDFDEFDFSDKEELFSPESENLFSDITKEQAASIEEPMSGEMRSAGTTYTSYDVHSALVDISEQVREALKFQHPGASDDELTKMLDEKLWAVDQFPRHRSLPMPDAPSIDRFREFISDEPTWLAESPSKYMRGISEAIEAGKSDDEIESLIEKAPKSHMPDELFKVQGIAGAFRSALGPRLIKASAGSKTLKTPEMRWSQRRQSARDFDKIIKEQGKLEAMKMAWESNLAMPEEEAKEIGLISDKMLGEERESFWGRAVEDRDDEGFFIPAGLKDIPGLVKRGFTKLGVQDVFAPLFLDEEDYEQYKKEAKMLTPTEGWETVVRTVWNEKDKGKSAEEIKSDVQEQLYATFLMNSYSDLPSSVRLDPPSADILIKYAAKNPQVANDKTRPGLARLVRAANAGGATKADLQKALMSVPFGQLPIEIWRGNVKSLSGIVDKIYEGADKSIEAISESGGLEARELEKDFTDLMLTTEERDGEIYVVESGIGQLLRMVGMATETVAEADISIPGLEWAAITPASRDFYYAWGIRDANTSYLARILANTSLGEVGFSRHLTDEALARGYDQADPIYRMYAYLGLGLDFLVPWEKYHVSAAIRPVRAVHRGYKANKLVGMPGFRAQAFLAGMSPTVYSYINKSSERVSKSSYSLQQRLGKSPDISDIKEALAKTGDDILTYNERWLASKLVEKMEGKKPLSYDKAIDEIAVSAKTDVFETVGDVAENIVRHIMDSPDGGSLLRNLPWQFRREIDDIILASGADPSLVREAVKAYMGVSRRTHLAALEVLMRKGDPDTQLLRASDEYQAVLKQVNDLLDEGDITADQVPVLMALLENRAYTLAADEAVTSIAEPVDFFKKVKIRRTKKAVDDAQPSKTSDLLDIEKRFKSTQKDVSDFEVAVEDFQKVVSGKDDLDKQLRSVNNKIDKLTKKILGDDYVELEKGLTLDLDDIEADNAQRLRASQVGTEKQKKDLSALLEKQSELSSKSMEEFQVSTKLEGFGIDTFLADEDVGTQIIKKRKALKARVYRAKKKLNEARVQASKTAKKDKPETGERWTLEVRKSKKKDYFVFVNSSDMAPLSSIFRNKNLSQLLDENGLFLSRIMGPKWTNKFFRSVSNQGDMPDAYVKPGAARIAIDSDGANAIELLMRKFFFEKGGQIGAMRPQLQELGAQLSGIWMRMRGSADLVVPDMAVREFWDKTFSPAKILANEAIGTTNRINGLVRVVRISGDMEQAIKEELPARAGRKREFIGVEKNPAVVRQALGLTDDVREVNAVELYARSVGYAVGEHFKRHVGGMEFSKLTDWTFATASRARSITESVNKTMASILGVPVLNNKTIKGIFDDKENVLKLSDAQASSLRVHLRQLANEPISVRRLPDEIIDPSADLTQITNVQLNKIIEIMKDVEGGAFSKRTHYSEAISRSLGYSVLNALKAASRDTFEASDSGKALMEKFDTWFSLEDPYLDTLGPMQRSLLDKWLKKVQGVQKDVLEMMRVAIAEDPDIAIDAVFDKIRRQLFPDVDPSKAKRILGSTPQTLIPGRRKASDAKQGWFQFLSEFTAAEAKRNADEYAAAKQDLDLPESPAVLRGEEKMFPSEYEFFDISGMSTEEITQMMEQGGVSKLEFLLKRTSLDELEDLISDQSRGVNGLTERERQAFSVLGTYANKTPDELAKLDKLERVELADAIENVRLSLYDRARYIEMRGKKIFLSLMGGAGETLIGNMDSAQFGWFYTKFYEGGNGWIEMLDWLVNKAAREGGLWAERIPKYSPAQAFLEMIVRMRSYEIMDGMADDMMRHGVPVKMQDFVQPRPRIGPKGDVISIEAGNKFNERVKHYITEILEFGDIVVQRMHKVYDEDGNVVLADNGKPLLEPGGYEGFRAPKPESWAPGEYKIGIKSGENSHVHDLQAYGVATEILARFGHRFKSKDWVEMTFPDGSVGFVPAPMKKHIEKTIDRLSSVGWARGTFSARRLTPARVRAPMGIEPDYSREVRAKMTTAKAIDTMVNLFPATFANIKMGVTTGIGLPNPAYFVGNFIGGAFQLFTGVGPIGVAKTVMDPRKWKMTAAVMSRMWKEGHFKPGNPIIVAADGSIYTADQIAELAHIYGLKSSFISAETQRAMAEDVEIMLRKRDASLVGFYNRGADGARWWQNNLTETATAIDNFYRVSVFVEELEKGASARSAASLARKVAFDYAELSEFEKVVLRNVILFYSYMRKNMDLTIDTLLTEPSRLLGQLRLMNGMQQINVQDDTELVLKDYIKERLIGGFKSSTINQHATEGWMRITPPMPIMDAINLPMNMVGWVQDDPEAQRYMVTRLAAPWIQYPFVATLKVDPFYAKGIDMYNRVPPWLVELDRVLLGGILHDFLDIQNKPNFDPSRRSVEGDYYEGWYHANNGVNWWVYRNLLQIPGAGRSIDTITYMDRANLQAIEGGLALARLLRKGAETVGLAEELEDPYVGMAKDTMGPRPGLTAQDEFAGWLGFKPTELPTEEAAVNKIIKEWVKEAKRQPGIMRQSDWRRPIKRR
tara:strand:+ start:12971 stop:20563 length:7593 start_codon:yes stop_codon:yes gene_type:complete